MNSKPVGIALAAAVIVAGCGGSSSNGSSNAKSTPAKTSSGASSSGGGQVVSIGADPGGALKFTKTALAAKAGDVTFKFSNPSNTPHAFEIEGHGVEKETKTITGGSANISVKLKPGKYEFYCPVDGHKAAGMKGTLTVQ